jgi:predicted nucleic acid-binding protein
LIIDTSALIALFNDHDPAHAETVELFGSSTDDLIVSPYVVAELDYLVLTREGVQAELTVLRALSGGAWELAPFDIDDVRTAISLIERYTDQDIGLADASNVVLADRYSTRTIATFDHRHFDVLRPLRGGRFSVVP